MMFRGGSLPQPISDDLAVASIVDELGLGIKQYQDDKRVQMLNNPLQYLKARNAAYATIARTADDVYNAALFQIATSVTEGVPADDGAITDRANALAGNTDAVGAALDAWSPAVRNASRLLWVKRLAAETAMQPIQLLQHQLVLFTMELYFR